MEDINMQSSRLGLVGRLVLALLAVFMLGALVASAAQAEPTRALQWKVGGKVLANDETAAITIKDFETKAITLEAPTAGIKVICKEARAGAGSSIGNENEAAIGEVIAEFALCNVEGNGASCTQVKEPIVTKKTRSELTLNDEETTKTIGNKVLVEFDPAAGSGKEFVELKFVGTGCKFANTIVKDLVLGLLWTDPATNSGKEEEIELGKLPAEQASGLIKFPDNGAKSTFLWNTSTKKFELFTPTLLEAFNEKVTLEGTILVALASGKNYGLTETGK